MNDADTLAFFPDSARAAGVRARHAAKETAHQDRMLDLAESVCPACAGPWRGHGTCTTCRKSGTAALALF